MQYKRLFASGVMPIMLVLMALLLVACGGQTTGGTSTTGNTPANNQGVAPDDKQIYRYPIGNADFITLDPNLSEYSNGNYAIQALFSGLVGLNDNGEVVDRLAASHQVADDGVTYTFTLRDNIKFSDGTPITADDIVYSINRTIDPATKSEVAYYLDQVKGYADFQGGKVDTLIGTSLIAKDPKTVQIITGQPVGYFLASLTYNSSYVVNKKLIDKYGAQWTDHMQEGGNSGPFMVQEYSHTVGLTAVPNPHYYGGTAKLKKVQFLISGDADPTYKSYLAGQYDYAAIPPVELANAKNRPDYKNTQALTTWYLALNFLTAPFDNLKIRKAFALAIDKELLVKSVLRGLHKPTNTIIPPGAPGNDPNAKGLDGTDSTKGNIEMAKQLFAEGLKEAGYASIADLPPITFTNRNQQVAQDVAAAIIQQWKDKLGVDVKQNVLEIAKYDEQLNAAANNPKGIQIWYSGWGQDYPDPQNWLSVFFAKGVSNNQYNYGQNNSAEAADQQAVQEMLAKADVNTNQEERLKSYQEAQQKIVDQVGWVPLYHTGIHRLINPKLVNYKLTGYDKVTPESWLAIYVAQ